MAINGTVEAICVKCGWRKAFKPGEGLPPVHVCPASYEPHRFRGLPKYQEWARDGWRCRFCRALIPPREAHVICPGRPPDGRAA